MTKDTILGGHSLQFVVYNDTDTSKDALNITVSYTWDCLLDHFSAAVIQDVENCFCFVFCTYFVKFGVRTCQIFCVLFL